MNPLWKKLHGDVRLDRGRLTLTVLALALSLAGLGTMLDVYAVLIREITRNYQETDPAAATFELETVDRALVAAVREIPGVETSERRRALDARVREGDDWRPLHLFIVDDFEHMQLNRFTSQDGAWPPPTGTLLVERTAVRLMNLKNGDTLTVRSPNGPTTNLRIAGMVHDAGLAPSEQERTIYGYATEETLRALGETGGFDELRIRLTPNFNNRPAIVAKCQEIVTWLKNRGYTVHEVRVPPPNRHPHQGPMEAVLLSFIGFGAMALLLSAILLATTMTALLAKQVKEIAILKAIGGSRGQIAFIYGALALGIGIIAVIIALPTGLAVAFPFARQIATLINFSIASYTVPPHLLLFQTVVGLLLPVLAAAWPICRAVNLPVRVGLADSGVQEPVRQKSEVAPGARWFTAMPQWILVWRNAFRRRLRFILTLALLGTSGAILMSAFNLKTAWTEIIGRVYSERNYDVSIALRSFESIAAIETALKATPSVSNFEAWQSQPVAFHTPGQAPVVSTYPDGGHGSFTLFGVPLKTTMVAFPLLSGRWLREGDTDSVVLNHAAHAARRNLAVGDRISLSVDGQAREWTIVGFIEEVGSAATAYVLRDQLIVAGAARPTANLLRITTVAGSPTEKVAAIHAIEHALESRGLVVKLTLSLKELKTAMGAHISVLISTLIAAALVMGAVAGLGLSAMLSMSVIERTREFGVLRAVGATPADLVRMIIAEATVMGGFGLVAAIPLSVAVSALLGQIVGKTAFQIPLPLTFSGAGLFICFIALSVVIATAAGLPARSAGRLTVRTALDHR